MRVKKGCWYLLAYLCHYLVITYRKIYKRFIHLFIITSFSPEEPGRTLLYDTGFSRVSKIFNNMANLRDKIERISLITGYAAAALAGLTELLPEREHFSSAPIWYVASAFMAAYLINVATNPDPRHNREYNSAFSREKPVIQIYSPSRLDQANKK